MEMNRIRLLLLTICAGLLLTTHAMTPPQENNDKTLLSRAYAEMYCAMIAKDTASLGRLLAEDFVLEHMTGLRQPKADYLRAIAQGALNYYTCSDTQLDITIDGDSGRMTGRSRVEAAVFGGRRHAWRLRLDITLARREGSWLMTGIRAGTY